MGRLLFAVSLLAWSLSIAAADRAVLVYPRERPWFRRVFYTTHQQELQRTLSRTFAVSVHSQVGTLEELLRVDVDGARLLVLSGHGSPFALSLGPRNQRSIESAHLDLLRAFFGRMAPDATIVLQSCETGRGFAWMVKEAAGGRRVVAAKGTVPPDGMTIPSLSPLEIAFSCTGPRGEWDCRIAL